MDMVFELKDIIFQRFSMLGDCNFFPVCAPLYSYVDNLKYSSALTICYPLGTSFHVHDNLPDRSTSILAPLL